jgi:hypothetical protein
MLQKREKIIYFEVGQEGIRFAEQYTDPWGKVE